MRNKRAPKKVSKYLMYVVDKGPEKYNELFHYCQTQKEAKSWARGKPGKKYMFKIIFDYIGPVK